MRDKQGNSPVLATSAEDDAVVLGRDEVRVGLRRRVDLEAGSRWEDGNVVRRGRDGVCKRGKGAPQKA